ncbi:polysaccharide deacetylase family protein [Paenibacillus tepidiphilus]|uniref:polysaccharide deacetylase family protein n=1 Tax=Paenibacillus tepidiphilus TaxID=2608683 RepID=UPI00123BDDDC|nr:polysaccharide deacetylase family protein [Paenibacillus tepidiphilus]
MQLQLNLFPGGLPKALTLSYDDGQVHDVRLAGIMDKYGIKGTFHLNSANLGREGFLSKDEVVQVLAGHEVSAHSVTHPHLEQLPAPLAVHEMLEDRRALEQLAGYPVRGMSYPFGSYSEELIPVLRSLGLVYSRTVNATKYFGVPADFMKWHPTCHHSDGLAEIWERFITQPLSHSLCLCYVWGHSYEFASQDNWDLIEDFCAQAGGREDVWYATNIEIYDYVTALRSLYFSADRTMIGNPSALDVWISVDGEPLRIPAGTVHRIEA